MTWQRPSLPPNGPYNHLFLNGSLQDNLTFSYYPSGHMFYQHEPSLRQFRQDAEAWYQ